MAGIERQGRQHGEDLFQKIGGQLLLRPFLEIVIVEDLDADAVKLRLQGVGPVGHLLVDQLRHQAVDSHDLLARRQAVPGGR